MTADLNFEAEPFDAFGSHSETSQEFENVHDHRVAGLVPPRDHLIGASAAALRDHRTGSSTGPVRGWNTRPSTTPGFPSPRFANVHGGFGTSPAHVISRRPGYGRGISDFLLRDRGLFRGILNRGSSDRGWYGARPAIYGARGFYGSREWRDRDHFPRIDGLRRDFRRRWPWMSRDGRDGGRGSGFGFGDVGHQGFGNSEPDYSGSGSSTPSSGGSDYSGSDYSGSDYSGSDYSGSDSSGSGFAPGAPAPVPGLGSSAVSDDPQIVAWAQGCLAQIVGGWVPQDGKLGRLTLRAIAMFQSHSQLPSTGTLDDNTLSAIQQACHAITAAGALPSPDQTPLQGPPTAATSGPLPSVVSPDTAAGQPPTSGTDTSAPSPSAAASTIDPSTGVPPQSHELPYWSHEYQEYENNPRLRPCEPNRCTSSYLRWLQNSLNQVFGQRLAVTGTLDDPTMAAINRFRLGKKLRVSESYHVGPAIEDALLAAGAPQPPAVPPTQCAASDPSKLIPILDQARGDIPLEFLLGWIDVESAWVLEPPSVTCERGYFQLYPEDSVNLNLDHDRIGTDPVYSIQAGVPFVNRARKQIERAVKAFGVPRNSDLYWRLVKLWHWIPSGPEKILAAMSAQGARATDWESVRVFVRNNFDALSRIIRRDPQHGIRSVDHMFARVAAWRKRLHP